MNAVEAYEADENEIDGDDEVQQPGHDQDQDAGDEGDGRREIGGGDEHWIFLWFR
jgi:hypothetical protein